MHIHSGGDRGEGLLSWQVSVGRAGKGESRAGFIGKRS